MAKSAVFAAMHTENVRKTVSAKPLARHKDRAEYFRSKRNVSMIYAPFRSLRIGQPHTPPSPRIQYVQTPEKFRSRYTKREARCGCRPFLVGARFIVPFLADTATAIARAQHSSVIVRSLHQSN